MISKVFSFQLVKKIKKSCKQMFNFKSLLKSVLFFSKETINISDINT